MTNGRTKYLVTLNCMMDDFPLSLHESFNDAAEAARECDGTIDSWDVFGRDQSQPACVTIVTFMDHTPVKVHKVKEFDSEVIR